MADYLMMSGGVCSWATGLRLKQLDGITPEMLFADTLIEDDDLYRFLVQAAANLRDLPDAAWKGLAWMWETLPPIDRPGERLARLQALAAEAMNAIPGLHWVLDGRTPWDVFRKERFIGNTRHAKCSEKLKQDASRAWLGRNANPDADTIHVGIHVSEIDRYTGTNKKAGIREFWLPWRCRAPLCELPIVPAAWMMQELDRAGIQRPRLYGLGFLHNNCGAFCVKAGQGHFANLLRTMPDRYRYHEGKEEELRVYLGKDVSILRDRRGGETRPLTLREFRLRLEAGESCDRYDVGGCNCFTSTPDDD